MDNDHKQWYPLEPGDIVDIVAPGCGCTDEEISAAVHFIEALDLEARIPDDITKPHALCSNTDDYRSSHLKDSLVAKDSKAIWCLRGGYGSARIIPTLEYLRQPRKSKLFIGFSDITSLHIFLRQKWKWSTIHGPVLAQLGSNKVDSASVDQLKAIIFGQQEKLVFPELEPLNKHAEKDMSLYASVMGGNLCLIQTSIGTSWQLKGTGNIIFIEDIGERGYSIDRMLVHLTQAGIFQDAKAVLFGDFVGGEEKDGISLSEPVIRSFAHHSDIPVLKCSGIGHGPVNHPLPLGTPSILKLGSKPMLTCNVGFGS